MLRPSMNLPKAEFPIKHACATRVPLIRNLIRRRCRARSDTAVEVSEAEQRLWAELATQRLIAPPSPPPMPTVEDPVAGLSTAPRNSALGWAASTLFSVLFSVHEVGDGPVRPPAADGLRPQLQRCMALVLGDGLEVREESGLILVLQRHKRPTATRAALWTWLVREATRRARAMKVAFKNVAASTTALCSVPKAMGATRTSTPTSLQRVSARLGKMSAPLCQARSWRQLRRLLGTAYHWERL